MSTAKPEDDFESERTFDHERSMEIFLRTLDYPSGPDRDAYLDEACGGDVLLRKRVKALLVAVDQKDRLLDLGLTQLAELDGLDLAKGLEEKRISEHVPEKPPATIGLFRIERELGHGGFGQVYLGYDEDLQRPVAIKVPHQKFLKSLQSDPSALNEKEQKRQQDAFQKLKKEYLEEAQKLAKLDHRHIVPVYTWGSTDRFPCYIVSKYIEGMSLAERIKEGPFTPIESAELIATIADALHHAHQKGVYHRDIKPGNLFLDKDGNPYVGDFGLALREEDIGTGHKMAGTPQYMSPEQASGEGHRVDGRTDIFSLGVIFYELLSGKRPFRGDSKQTVLEQVRNTDPRPPRQYNDRIPQELERICLKSLAKKASDRYSIAKDFADELRYFLQDPVPSPSPPQTARQEHRAAPPTLVLSPEENASGGSTKLIPPTPVDTAYLATRDSVAKIVPRGLQSFDAHDADFFLDLVPGPRDRNGLPESLRFWKTRIEASDTDQMLQIGMIFGPSGCGKSSLIKAGLLPRLSKNVITIYLEATANHTETGVLKRVQKRCPHLPATTSLSETLQLLRRGHGLAAGQKVLIVLDQFEQWLDANHELRGQELIQALRQCDGEHLQCIILVRDEFCLRATQFLKELEIPVSLGKNTAMVDLFHQDHAAKILSMIGHAFGRLPEHIEDQSPEQQAFVQQALAGLAQQEKFACIRLSLFADMMKSYPWTAASLKQVGGTAGIELTFLEQSFSKSSSLIQLRQHQSGARAVLKALLPEMRAEIKGGMKSYRELQGEADYSHRPAEFDAMIRTLSSELRLITPINPHDSDDENAKKSVDPRQTYYQLTHDYLVRSLREWLTRKQRETRRGRSELCLEERASIWQHKPESRQLPSLGEYLSGWWHVPKANQTPIQQKMMRTAARTHAFRWGTSLGLMMCAGASAYGVWAGQVNLIAKKHDLAIRHLENTQGSGLDLLLGEITGPEYDRATIVSLLKKRFYNSKGQQKQNLAHGLARFDQPVVPYLCSTIFYSPASEVDNLVTTLAYNRPASLAELKNLSDQATAQSDWKHKAKLAITGLFLGDVTIALEMCQVENRPDPVQRTLFIDTLSHWHGDLAALSNLWKTTMEANLCSALACGIGSMSQEHLSGNENDQLKQAFQRLYETAPDAATHSSVGWALQKWGLKGSGLKSAANPNRGQDWFVNSEQITMIRITPGEFLRFVENDQNAEAQLTEHKVTLTRSYFLGDCEISGLQFLRFIEDPDYPEEEKPREWKDRIAVLRINVSAPAQRVNWNDAVLFCNWLSKKEGLTPCYARKALDQNQSKEGEWDSVMPGTGYRLPTDAEWEHACRAGTTTLFSCGNDEGVLTHYAVIRTFEPAVTGSKLPNAWGLFDMHGNMNEWCHDAFQKYATGHVVDPIEDRVSQSPSGVMRGGSYSGFTEGSLSKDRSEIAFESRQANLGFRVARNADGFLRK